MPVQTELILRAILDYSPENIVLMDRDYRVICYNERIRQTPFKFHGRYLEVGDDYRDFVVEMAMLTFGSTPDKKSTGIGLENIRRRVQILGGSVRIKSSTGEGVSLTAFIPL